MLKSKSIIATFLAITSIVILVGCSSSTSKTAVTSKTDFWNDKAQKSTQTKMFNVIKPKTGIGVNVIPYASATTYSTSLKQSIDGSSAPGMFTWWSGDQLKLLVKNGDVVDLTNEWKQYYEKAGVNSSIADAFTFDGKVYAAPYSMLYNVIYYNKPLFDKYGLKQPTTFKEFENVCDVLVSKGVKPIGLKSDSWASFLWFQQLVASYKPSLYTDLVSGKVKYTDPQMKEVFAKWQEFINKGYFAQPVDGNTEIKQFATAKTAMIYEPNTASTDLVTNYKLKSGSDFDAFIMPSMKGDKSVIFFEATPLCISSKSKQKDAAIKVMQSFYDTNAQQMLADEHGIVNTSKVKVLDPTTNKIMAYTNDKNKYQLVLRYYEGTPTDIMNYALDELSKFMNKAQTSEKTLSNIETKAQSVWSTYK